MLLSNSRFWHEIVYLEGIENLLNVFIKLKLKFCEFVESLEYALSKAFFLHGNFFETINHCSCVIELYNNLSLLFLHMYSTP